MVDTTQFRHALGRFATGVTVVAAAGRDGRVAGLTANAFSAVSLDPPLVLVCVRRESGSLAVLRRAGRFAVHILRHDQRDVALAFAASGPDKLAGVALAFSARGNPVLDDYLTLLECELASEYDGGDHAILVGRVLRCDVGDEAGGPLTVYRGELGALRPAAPL